MTDINVAGLLLVAAGLILAGAAMAGWVVFLAWRERP